MPSKSVRKIKTSTSSGDSTVSRENASVGINELNDIYDRLLRLQKYLSSEIERQDDAIKATIAGLLADANTLYLGLPGTGKTTLSKSLANALNAKPFKVTLTPESTLTNIYGPVDIKALRERSENVRSTEGMLPDADIVFIDEIFRGNPSVLNALLPVLAERKFYNGKEMLPIKAKGVFTTSNRPISKMLGGTTKNQHLPLLDRFNNIVYMNELNIGDMLDIGTEKVLEPEDIERLEELDLGDMVKNTSKLMNDIRTRTQLKSIVNKKWSTKDIDEIRKAIISNFSKTANTDEINKIDDILFLATRGKVNVSSRKAKEILRNAFFYSIFYGTELNKWGFIDAYLHALVNPQERINLVNTIFTNDIISFDDVRDLLKQTYNDISTYNNYIEKIKDSINESNVGVVLRELTDYFLPIYFNMNKLIEIAYLLSLPVRVGNSGTQGISEANMTAIKEIMGGNAHAIIDGIDKYVVRNTLKVISQKIEKIKLNSTDEDKLQLLRVMLYVMASDDEILKKYLSEARILRNNSKKIDLNKI